MRRKINMNTARNIAPILKGRALYARIKSKKTGAALAKRMMLAAYSKSLKREKCPPRNA